MDVSVVIATHNQRGRLELVLLSVYRQLELLPSDCELVVVDNASSDGTPEFLKEFASRPSVRVKFLARNLPRNAARNVGLQVCKGDLVAFLDGDSLPHPSWLERVMCKYEQFGPNCVLCSYQKCIPDIEFLDDLQSGTLMDGVEVPSVVRARIHRTVDSLLISTAHLDDTFTELDRRAVDGGYPVPVTRLMQEHSIELYARSPRSPIGWVFVTPTPWSFLASQLPA